MSEHNPNNPKPYLKAADKSTWKKPDEVTWGDYSFNPNKPLTPKQKEACRLAASGIKQNDIAKELGYTKSWLSRLLTSEKAKNEVQRYQDMIFEKSVAERIKSLQTPALDYVEEILTCESEDFKPALKFEAAKWAVEKHDGKATQKHSVEGSVVVDVLDSIKQMKESGQIIDVTPDKEIPQIEGETGEKTEEVSSERKKLDAFLDTDI